LDCVEVVSVVFLPRSAILQSEYNIYTELNYISGRLVNNTTSWYEECVF